MIKSHVISSYWNGWLIEPQLMRIGKCMYVINRIACLQIEYLLIYTHSGHVMAISVCTAAL